MNKDLVSIIIPVYNVEKYINKCVDSCLKQTYENIEIILINDGATDNSPAILDELKKIDKRIKVFHKENGGVSSARNLGIEKSLGKYITFLDADDYLSNDFVDYMVNLLENNNSDFALSTNCFTSINQNQLSEKIEILNSLETVSLLLSQKIEVGCWNKLYKAEIIKNNNMRFLTELFYGEGLYFINTYAQFCKKVTVGKKRVYYYRKNNLDSATTKFKYENFVNGEKSLNKIHNELKKTTKDIERTWKMHYCLFCINAIVGILNNKEYNSKLNDWKNKINIYFFDMIFDFNVPLKFKIKLFILNLFPKLLTIRSKKKASKKIEESI